MPVITAEDLDAVGALFVDRLGLVVDMDEPPFQLLSSPGTPAAQLVVNDNGTTDPPPYAIAVDIDDAAAVTALHDEMAAAGERMLDPLQDTPWGIRRFTLRGPGQVPVVVLSHLPTDSPSPDDGDAAEPAGRPARTFRDENLQHARFVECDLSGAVLRGVDVAGMEIDAPWLLDGTSALLVNGVDVAPLVDAELNRRFPGREQRRAGDPETLRAAWAALEHAWQGTLRRVATMPDGTVDISVAGEWSFAQTLRHLVMATDTWLGRAVLEQDQPYHPIGLPHVEYETEGHDVSVFHQGTPPFADVLEARADRVARVRGFLANVTPAELAVPRRNPWAPDHPETTLSCLHTILHEEWEHLRFAVRDLDAIEAGLSGR
jgi:hypothetical protein